MLLLGDDRQVDPGDELLRCGLAARAAVRQLGEAVQCRGQLVLHQRVDALLHVALAVLLVRLRHVLLRVFGQLDQFREYFRRVVAIRDVGKHRAERVETFECGVLEWTRRVLSLCDSVVIYYLFCFG